MPWLFQHPSAPAVRQRGKPVTQDVGGLEPVIAMPLDVAPVDTADRHNLAGMELLPWINHELVVPRYCPDEPAAQPGVKGPGEPVPLRGQPLHAVGDGNRAVPVVDAGCGDPGATLALRAWWAVPACSSPAGSTPRAGILPSEWPPTRSFDRRGSAHPTPGSCLAPLGRPRSAGWLCTGPDRFMSRAGATPCN